MHITNRQPASREKESFFNPGNVFLILGLLAGILYSIFIPYGAGFDEEQHVIRISDISFLHMLPNRSKNATMTYREFFSLSYQRRFFNSPAEDLFSPDNFYKKFDLAQRLRSQTRSIYSPVMFFPQAFVAGIFWRIMNFPVIPVIILERLAGLLVYLLGAYLAIRWLPFGKWVLMVLALAPMALFQAATLNADGFTNAVSFLFIGLTLKAFAEKDTPIRPWQVWGLVCLALLLGLAKPGSIVLLPLLLLLPYRRFPSKALFITLWAGALLAVAVTFGWTALSVSHSHFAASGSQDLNRQLDIIKSHPVDFLLTFAIRNITSAVRYFRDWMGVYGYWVGVVPEPVYWFYPLALLAAILVERRNEAFSWKTRLFMIGLFLASSAAIALQYYYLHYTPGDMSSLGKQGRYFIPMAPLLYLSLAGLVPARAGPLKAGLLKRAGLQQIASVLAAAFLFIAVGYYSFGLYATYYTECGYSVYTGKSCTLPVYKNLDIYNPPTILVNSATTVSQTFTSHCGSLEAVQVLVKSLPEETKGTLRYSLLDKDGNVIAAKDFPVSEIPPDAFLELPATSGLKNASYEIRLESPDLPPSTGIGIALRDGTYYRYGVTRANGSLVGADSIFFYRCPNPQLQKP